MTGFAGAMPAWKAVACPKCGSGPGTPCFKPRLGAPAQLLRCAPHTARRLATRDAAPPPARANAADDDFDPLVFDMLRAAVNLGRQEEIRSAERLRSRMMEVYPDVPKETIERSLALWADYGRRTHMPEQ